MRLFIAFLFFPFVSSSQSTINAEQFFRLGLSDFEQTERSVGDAINFPWIERYEFRTETRDFDPARQEYTVRLSPSSIKIRNAQKSYYATMSSAPDLEGQEMYYDDVASLHQDWLSLFILDEQRNLLDTLVLLLQDKQQVYSKMLGTYEFDPEKLVKLQIEKSELAITRHELDLEWNDLLDKYSLQNQTIDFANFISVEALSNALANYILADDMPTQLNTEIAYEQQLLMREMELETAERRQLVDFVQLRYNGPHSDELRERVSVGLGFQVFNSGSQQIKLQELRMEEEALQRELERKTKERVEELRTLERELQTDIQAFFHFRTIMEDERKQFQSLSRQVAQKAGTSPLFLLDIEERHLSMQLKLLSRKKKLMEDYLEYLERSERLYAPNAMNPLTR